MSSSETHISSPRPMQRLWSTIASRFSRHAGLVVVVVTAVTLICGYGTTKLEFATGQDSYLDSSQQVAKDNVAYQSLFGGQAMLTVFEMAEGTTVADLFTPTNRAQFKTIERDLSANPGVLAVVSPLNTLELTHSLQIDDAGDPVNGAGAKVLLDAQARDPDPAGKELRTQDILDSLARIQAIPVEQRNLDNPAWVDVLLHDNQGKIRKSLLTSFPDETHAQLVVRLQGNASIEDEGLASDLVVGTLAERDWENATTTTTGAPVLLKDINDYLRGGFLSLGGIALVIMGAILLTLFAVRWRLLPLGAVFLGVVWAFGVAGFVGLRLSVMTIAGLPVLLGVGIDFVVQLHSRVEEEARIDRSGHPVRDALVNLMPALIVATAAAMIAFLTIRHSEVPMIRDFGLLLALGLPIIVIAAVVVTTTALGRREARSPTVPGDYSHGALGRFVVGLGSLPPKAVAVPLMVLAVVVFLGGSLTESSLTLQTDPEKWVAQDSQVIQDVNHIRTITGSAGELGVFVQSDDVFDDATTRFVDTFARETLARYPDDLVTATSLVTTVSYFMEVEGATPLPPTGEDLRLAYDVAPAGIRTSLVNPDSKAVNLVFRTGGGSLENTARVVNEIRGTVAPPQGVRATPSGLAVVGAGLLDNINASRIQLTYLALGWVFLFLLVRYRNIAQVLLSMVPVVIAVGTASLIAVAAGFELSPLTVVGGPLVVALCTEFTCLIVMRHLEERRRGEPPRVAVHTAAARTGQAFVVSALTAIVGVAVLASSPLPLLRDFGIAVAINVGVALLSALVVLPPLLIWADELGWVYRDRTPQGDPCLAASGGPPSGGTRRSGRADRGYRSYDDSADWKDDELDDELGGELDDDRDATGIGKYARSRTPSDHPARRRTPSDWFDRFDQAHLTT